VAVADVAGAGAGVGAAAGAAGGAPAATELATGAAPADPVPLPGPLPAGPLPWAVGVGELAAAAFIDPAAAAVDVAVAAAGVAVVDLWTGGCADAAGFSSLTFAVLAGVGLLPLEASVADSAPDTSLKSGKLPALFSRSAVDGGAERRWHLQQRK